MAESEKIKGIDLLKRFVRRWQQQQLLRQLLLSLALGFAFFFLLQLWVSALQAGLWSLVVGIGCGLLLYWRRPSKRITPAAAAAWLDQQHPRLEHSSGLLLEDPAHLSIPARLQQRQVEAQMRALLSKEKPPVNLLHPLASLALVLLAGMLLLKVWQPQLPAAEALFASNPPLMGDSAARQSAEVKRALPQLKEGRLRLAPPAYTGQPARFYALSDLEAPQDSRLTWQLRFNEEVEQVFMADQQNDTLHFQQTSKGAWVAQRTANTSFFYRLGYATATDTAFSPFLKVKVQADEPPRAQILKPEQYLLGQQGDAFRVSVEASDDYGLEDVYLSLTISRGSGENVQFREEKMWVEIQKGSREVKKELSLSPKALGMQPGDELYYRLEAHDNKPPRGQHRRSNSWFYQWQDTAAAVSALSSGLALDVEPEYFRSQRQIIIDTEKLISTQNKRPVAEWEKANQNLAVDQKLLRLRYGKFLGEEFESTAGGVLGPEEAHEEHEHEEGEEAGEHAQEDETEYGNDRHEHDLPGHEEPAGAAPASGLLEMFGHAHDTEEGATFYEESIKVKLKAALAQMWEAEKYLRLSQPRQALPYEYQALKIIKEVQQASRIYVERVGLELPVLIPGEYRLKGEMEEVQAVRRSGRAAVTDSLWASRQLLNRLSYWEEGERLSAAELQLVRQSSREVARLLMAGGPYMGYFYLLNSLNSLLEESVPPAGELRRLQAGLYHILPDRPSPSAQALPLNKAQQLFLKTQSKPQRD